MAEQTEPVFQTAYKLGPMLRIVPSRAASNAKDYFTEGLSREDYYAGEREVAGQWFGKGAERLGLSGEVVRHDFAALCENVHPQTGERLTPLTKPNRRIGFDFNFHCPKSVSVMFGLGYDDRILNVFHDAVRHTMAEIEGDAKTRVRVKGADEDRSTGNLTWAEFTHFTARPMAGLVDPHLHAHCFVFNATFDTLEDRWKAGQFGDIKRDAPYFEAKYLARLAEGLVDLGYDLTPKGKFWELSCVPEHVVRSFSTRSQHIEKVARERGIENPREKARLGAKTRRSKKEERAGQGRRESWRERVTPEDQAAMRHGREGHNGRGGERGVGGAGRSSKAARDAVEYSLGRCFERTAVVPERLLYTLAFEKALGKASETDLAREFDKAGLIKKEIDGEKFVTTKAVLAEEQRMLDIAAKGRGQFQPLMRSIKEPKGLNAGQFNAVNHALESRDFVTIIEGKAGSGKTTLLAAFKEQLDKGMSAPKSQVYLSPTTRGRDRLKESGFDNAGTVAGMLADPGRFGIKHGGVLVVDEAGLLGTSVMLTLLEKCKEWSQRLILVGDHRQFAAQSRGRPLRSLREHAGVLSAGVDEIVRQSGYMKEVATALSEGRMKDGLRRLDQMGCIQECKPENLAHTVAKEYVDQLKDGRSTLLITPSKQERAEVEPAIREALVENKTLGKARTIDKLTSCELTHEEKRREETYRKGQVIQFIQNTPRGMFMPEGSNFTAGTRWEVLGHDALNNVLIKRIQSVDPFGKIKVKESFPIQHLPLKHADRFEVFNKSEIEIRVGERIRITGNGRTHSVFDALWHEATDSKRFPKRELVNGNEHEVKRFTRDGDLHLDNGLIVRKDFGHLEYSYCTSSVRAQGSNVDRVILVQTELSGKAANCREVYVSLTRGAQRASVYTHDKTEFMAAAEREAKDWTATDLAVGKAPPDLVKAGIRNQRESAERDHARHSERDSRERD